MACASQKKELTPLYNYCISLYMIVIKGYTRIMKMINMISGTVEDAKPPKKPRPPKKEEEAPTPLTYSQLKYRRSKMRPVSPRVVKVFHDVVVNGERITTAMRANGWADGTANSPKKLTTTRDWQELLATYVPDDLLAREHNKVLVQDRDLSNKMRAVETGYKLKGKLSSGEGVDNDIKIAIVFQNQV